MIIPVKMEPDVDVTYHITGDIPSGGGYKKLVVKKKKCQSLDIFVFPKKGTSLTSNERKLSVQTFIQKLYNVMGDQVDKILSSIIKPMSIDSSAEPAVAITSGTKRPSDDSESIQFELRKKLCLRPSHPGPALPFLEKGASHSEDITLRAQYYLNLSNDKFEWMEQYGGDRFSNRNRRRKRFKKLLGDEGRGWLKTRKIKFSKKKTKNSKEPEDSNEELIVITTRVEGTDVKLWMENHVSNLIETGQFKDLTTMENCPASLKDTVVWSAGVDAGDGTTKMGAHPVNITKSNSGSTSPIMNLVNTSDKKFSNWQWKQLFQPTLEHIGSFPELEVTDLQFGKQDSEEGGEDVDTRKKVSQHDHGYSAAEVPKRIIKNDVIWCTDLEATATALGHQGFSAKYPCHKCEIDHVLLEKETHSKEPHNFNTVKAELRTASSYKSNFEKNVRNSLGDLEVNSNDGEKKLRGNGKTCKSVIGPNLINLDPDHIIDSPVHIKIGDGNRMIDIVGDEIASEQGEEAAKKFLEGLERPWGEGGLGVSRGNYHGGKYAGGDISVFMNHPDRVLSLIPSSFSRLEVWRQRLAVESRLFYLLDVARFLSDDEVKEVGELILKLSELVKTHFHMYSITPKLHILLVHIYPLVVKWRSIGLFSEQAMENLHQIVKKDSVFFKSMEIHPMKHNEETVKHQYVRAVVRGVVKD